jgi:hypothetical protein
MLINCLLGINRGGHKSFIDLSCHFREEKTNTKKGKEKIVCQVAMPNGSMVIWIKRICKAC